jgi:hypothetical protein
VLFDVDGTLLLTHDEVYMEASRLALEAVYGTYADGPDIPGDTAPAHIRRAPSGRAIGLWNARSESETRLSTSRARTPQAATPSA